MSAQRVLEFREAVHRTPAMQEEIRSLARRGAFDPVQFARARGYSFTRDDLAGALAQLQGKLSDFELELLGRQHGAALRDLPPRGDVVGGATSTDRTSGGKTIAPEY